MLKKWFKTWFCDHQWNEPVVVWHETGNPIDVWGAGGVTHTKYAHTCIKCNKEQTWIF